MSTKEFEKWIDEQAKKDEEKYRLLAEAQTRKVQDPREQAWFDEA